MRTISAAPTICWVPLAKCHFAALSLSNSQSKIGRRLNTSCWKKWRQKRVKLLYFVSNWKHQTWCDVSWLISRFSWVHSKCGEKVVALWCGPKTAHGSEYFPSKLCVCVVLNIIQTTWDVILFDTSFNEACSLQQPPLSLGLRSKWGSTKKRIFLWISLRCWTVRARMAGKLKKIEWCNKRIWTVRVHALSLKKRRKLLLPTILQIRRRCAHVLRAGREFCTTSCLLPAVAAFCFVVYGYMGRWGFGKRKQTNGQS